ncbi:helix-loop-helix protein delilah-like [Homalodisca vitripennis]|uniref:helix-loop-helix protein delilah-like n=1 Tax=Homalodisca vitripennis TaxID=197043 RepID=UPI001EEBF261|nr:helix-loop-helix protein delilah-like [Homalodisca vitripennis]
MATTDSNLRIGKGSSKTDPNNNFCNPMNGYSLRPRTTRRCDDENLTADPDVWRPPKDKKKHKSMPLSKYRRKTANARERSRMREINDAFEALRRAIPQMESRNCPSEKLTKISTLRLAMRYISALDGLLRHRELESDGESLLSDYTLTPPDPSDLFTPLMTTGLEHLSGPPGDPCMITPEPLFTHSSYVFDETQLMDFN